MHIINIRMLTFEWKILQNQELIFQSVEMFHKTNQAFPKAESFLVYAFDSGEITRNKNIFWQIPKLKKKSHVSQIFHLKTK